MDRDYKREAKRYRIERNIPDGTELTQQDFPDFPIERARLRSVYLLNAIFVISTALYGTAVEWHIAIPLILQFFGQSRTRDPTAINEVTSRIFCHRNLQHQFHHDD
jgi:hypothetical protein